MFKKPKAATYCMYEKPDSDIACVQIKNGPFSGLVVRYGKVSIAEKPEADGRLKFNFEYDIIENPKDYEANDDMFAALGNVLVDIIMNDTKEKKRMKLLGIFQRK